MHFQTMCCSLDKAHWRVAGTPTEERSLFAHLLAEYAVLVRQDQDWQEPVERRPRAKALLRRLETLILEAVEPASLKTSAQSDDQIPAIILDRAYVSWLHSLAAAGRPLGAATAGGLGASIVAPDAVSEHLSAYEAALRSSSTSDDYVHRQRRWFLKQWILARNAGLVELTLPDFTSTHEPRLETRSPIGRLLRWLLGLEAKSAPAEASIPSPWRRCPPIRSTRVLSQPGSAWRKFDGRRSSDRGGVISRHIREAIDEALSSGQSLNLASQRHHVLVPALGEHILRKDTEASERCLPVTYGDGLPASSFPLRCLERLPQGWRPEIELDIGLVSMRHLDIDHYIDLNWFRNQEIPSFKGMCAADAYCTARSQAIFAELTSANPGKRLRINIYHSGYMPAVVGFYRAFMQGQRNAPMVFGNLQVVPHLSPSRGGYTTATPWPPTSDQVNA